MRAQRSGHILAAKKEKFKNKEKGAATRKIRQGCCFAIRTTTLTACHAWRAKDSLVDVDREVHGEVHVEVHGQVHREAVGAAEGAKAEHLLNVADQDGMTTLIAAAMTESGSTRSRLPCVRQSDCWQRTTWRHP